MTYEAKNYDRLIGMEGFSEALLRNHFTLYQGYVANTNKVHEAIEALAKEGKQGTPEFAELTRRFGWEWNGMRLHELYFDNLGNAAGPSDGLKLVLARDFGSFDSFKERFLAVGAMRGIGWTILYQDGVSGRLFISWVNEHDVGHLAGSKPLLVMDCFEHAFMLDYGLKRAAYLDAFWRNLNFKVVEERLG